MLVHLPLTVLLFFSFLGKVFLTGFISYFSILSIFCIFAGAIGSEQAWAQAGKSTSTETSSAGERSHNVRKMIQNRLKQESGSSVSLDLNQNSELRHLIDRAKIRFSKMNSDFRDYRCVVTMQENIGGELNELRRAKLLVRSEPFSVYMKYISPDEIENREVIYVDGKYNNRLISNKGGKRPVMAQLTRALEIDCPLAMKESDHQITEIGMGGIMEQLLDVADIALSMPEIEIGFIQGASVDGRPCTVIEIRHEAKTPDFPFYFARVFVDDQWEIPVRFVCYDWPTKEDPNNLELLEEFTYTQIEMNIDAQDEDFDYLNPRYGFSKKELNFQQ